MLGETVSHYRILEKLGQGGMGEVYLAEDTRLGRKVALKFLAPELVRDRESLARFRNEARAAAELSHPNIATIYDFDEGGSRPFLALEYLQGQTLKDRIEQGPLPIEDVLRIGKALAAGLVEAHAHGIVHRDMKSANVILTEKDEVKILDFGLARRADATQLTTPGMALGTISYMSPEQARGELADARSDIWSVGVVLYECLTGRLPFVGDGAAIFEQIASSEVLVPTALRTGVPMELEHTVLRCLEKDPGLRFQHADDLLASLRALESHEAHSRARMASGPVARQRPKLTAYRLGWIVPMLAVALLLWLKPWKTGNDFPSEREIVAVLPFENLGVADDEYLAAGITDEIAARLTAVAALGVVARPSSSEYAKSEKSIQQIGEELGADYLLEGTVQWQNTNEVSQIRVTPRLIKVADGTHVWSEIYDEPITEVFRVQSSISKRVIDALDVTLVERERESIERHLTDNFEAYDAYMRGLEYQRRLMRTSEIFELAETMYRRAIVLDSNFAAAYAQLAMLHAEAYRSDQDHKERRLEWALSNIEHALELDPDLPEAYLAYGYYYYFGLRDYDRALDKYKVAETLAPNDYRTLEAIGVIYKRTGRIEKALEYYLRAFELNPRDAGTPLELGVCCHLLKRFNLSEYYFKRVISLEPDDGVGYGFLANLHRWGTGDLIEARRIMESAPAVQHPGLLAIMSRIEQEAYERNFEAALVWADKLGTDLADTMMCAYDRASLLVAMGRRGEAAADLETAEILLKRAIEEDENQAWMHVFLGDVCAWTDRKQEAIAHGLRATELVPVSIHPLDGTVLRRRLAGIYAAVGESAKAVEILETLLTTPSFTSVARLRTEYSWDPLRDDPGFRRLLAQYEDFSL